MSKRHSIFIENFMTFLSIEQKFEKLLKFEFEKLLKISFWRWYKCDMYIKTSSALNFKQIYVFHKFCLLKQIYLSKRTPYLALTFTCWIQKEKPITKSLCFVIDCKKILKVFVNCRKQFLMPCFSLIYKKVLPSKEYPYKRNHLLYNKVIRVLKKK